MEGKQPDLLPETQLKVCIMYDPAPLFLLYGSKDLRANFRRVIEMYKLHCPQDFALSTLI